MNHWYKGYECRNLIVFLSRLSFLFLLWCQIIAGSFWRSYEWKCILYNTYSSNFWSPLHFCFIFTMVYFMKDNECRLPDNQMLKKEKKQVRKLTCLLGKAYLVIGDKACSGSLLRCLLRSWLFAWQDSMLPFGRKPALNFSRAFLVA